MKTYASIVDGKVFNIFTAPENLELKDLIVVDITGLDVMGGDYYVDGKFSRPAVVQPTKKQVEKKKGQLAQALRLGVKHHVQKQSAESGIDLENPSNKEEHAFYNLCLEVSEKEVENAQQIFDLLATLPKFEVNHGTE